MKNGRDWSKARRNPAGYEEANPREKKQPTRGGSHVKPGKVRTLADMSEAERAEILKAIRRNGA